MREPHHLPGVGDLHVRPPTTYGIDALAAVLRGVNQYVLGNPQGECEGISNEIIHVLREGRPPRAIVRVNPPDDAALAEWRADQVKEWESAKAAASKGGPPAPAAPRTSARGELRLEAPGPWPATAVEEDETVFQPGPDRPQHVFTWLSQVGHGDCILQGRGGGHVWNFLRFAGRIYLIDASTSLYRELTRPADGRTPYWETAANPVPFHYLDPVDLGSGAPSKMKIRRYPGTIHPTWQALLRPPSPARGVAEAPW